MIDKAEGSLPAQMEFLKIEPVDLCFSALKFSDNGSAILRLFNSTLKIVKGIVKTHFPLTSVNILSLEEFVIESLDLKNDYEIPLIVLPKKIVTLELKFKKQ
jgi:alpha-mannosidase